MQRFPHGKQNYLAAYKLVVKFYAKPTFIAADVRKSNREEQQETDDAIECTPPCLLWCRGLVEVKSGCQEELHLLQRARISLSSLLFCSGKEVACRERIKYLVVKDTGRKNSP